MSQPIELIVANIIHEMAEQVDDQSTSKDAVVAMVRQKSGAKHDARIETAEKNYRCNIAATVAEELLCSIAHNARPEIVRRALAAIGAPHEDDEIWARIESAREVQRREAGGATHSN